jgi:glycosyltransferase involved in cell wall biosynthesis
MRLLMAMSCGALVVSEPAPDTRPYVQDEHLIVSPVDTLADALVRCLTDTELRRSTAERAYRFVMEDMQLGRILSQALRQAGPDNAQRIRTATAYPNQSSDFG